MIKSIKNRMDRILSDEYWRIAVRKRKDDRDIPLYKLEQKDQIKGFKLMPGRKHVTYADPFLFEYQGLTWMFYERQDLTDMHGTIWCRCLEPKQGRDNPYGDGKPFKVLDREFHLSYPQVFEYAGKVYMIPESRGAGEVSLYECKSFPKEWEYKRQLINESGVDTTVYIEGKTVYLYSFINNALRIYKGSLPEDEFLPEGLEIIYESGISGVLRPGGHFLKGDEGLIRPAQDCREYYGKALSFRKAEHICGTDEGDYEYYGPEILLFSEDGVNPIGFHTYNVTDKFEVIDILHREKSVSTFLKKVEWTVRNHVNNKQA